MKEDKSVVRKANDGVGREGGKNKRDKGGVEGEEKEKERVREAIRESKREERRHRMTVQKHNSKSLLI